MGAAGYIAPRHIRAISNLGFELVSAFDPVDPTSQVASLFPRAHIFTDFFTFESHFNLHPTDFVVICSPNHLHAEQIDWALRKGADVICEKPLVLHPDQLDKLADVEIQTGKKVYTILQMRTMDEIIKLKNKIDATSAIDNEVVVSYIAPRNNAYFKSWKGNDTLSGGILTNIGIHLFDLMIWIFGAVKEVAIDSISPKNIRGHMTLEKAKIKWFISVDTDDLLESNKGFYRKLILNGEEISLETGLDRLHDHVYGQILNGEGPGIREARPSIEFCNQLINSII